MNRFFAKKPLFLLISCLTCVVAGIAAVETGRINKMGPVTEKIEGKEELNRLKKKASHHQQLVMNGEVFDYPYSDLKEQLHQLGKKKITIFSYGSLMSYSSASKTLSPKTLKTRAPALAFGAKRLFNRDVKIRPQSHWGIPCNPEARGMLNVALTGNMDDMMNGVTIEVPLDEIGPILSREVGYDLVPILYTKWDPFQKGEKPTFAVGYTFRAKALTKYTDETILPRPKYYELSRDAAKEYGAAFYQIWLNSTYMSDGQTKISKWEKALDNQREKTQICLAPPLQ